MKVSQIPFNLLRCGDIVKSDFTSTKGVITGLIKESSRNIPTDKRYDSVQITWENGNFSDQFHMLLDRVTYIGAYFQVL